MHSSHTSFATAFRLLPVSWLDQLSHYQAVCQLGQKAAQLATFLHSRMAFFLVLARIGCTASRAHQSIFDASCCWVKGKQS